MFNDGDPKTNGEYKFFTDIKDKIQVIFDVGSHHESEYIHFEGEVHYFEPLKRFMDTLSAKPNKNKASYFNNFGLGDETKELFYYPRYESFYDRVNSCKISDEQNKVVLQIKKAKDYIVDKNINTIDFVKIDTEGYELKVLQGFGDYLANVKLVQFEYGGTFLDNNTKLIDVIHHLAKYGFHKFSYLTHYGTEPITDFSDHYNYCNIVCVNKNSTFVPF